jgi:hypothetical protein
LSKHRSFDTFYGSPEAMRSDNKNVLGASSARISSIFAEEGRDEYAASQDSFGYSTIDPLWGIPLRKVPRNKTYVCWAAFKLLLQKRV